MDRAERLRRARATLDAVKRSQKFVASPLTLATANDLGSDQAAVARTAPYLFLPANSTWLDMTAEPPAGGISGARHGILLLGEGDNIRRGEWLLIAYLRRPPPSVAQTEWDREGGFLQIGGRFDLLAGSALEPAFAEQLLYFRAAGGDLARLAATVWSLIALINTPRLADVREAALGQINAARAKRHRPPILQYKEVTIRIDRGELGRGFQLPPTGGRPLHHVRAFLRLKRGRVELVRPHWRGNPRFGVVVHRYVALRAEDEGGPWKGGPLPPPRIIP